MDPKSGGLTKGWDSNYVGGGFLAYMNMAVMAKYVTGRVLQSKKTKL